MEEAVRSVKAYMINSRRTKGIRRFRFFYARAARIASNTRSGVNGVFVSRTPTASWIASAMVGKLFNDHVPLDPDPEEAIRDQKRAVTSIDDVLLQKRIHHPLNGGWCP